MVENPCLEEIVMKLPFRRAMALVVLVGLAQGARAADGPYQDLLRRLPDSTNVIVVADVTALRQALGVAPGTALMASDMCTLPIACSKFVLGAHVDMSERRHVWSIAMAQHGGKLPIGDIAKAESEQVDQVAGYNVVPCMRNGYFIELAPDVLGAGSPANRQQLKRWLTYQKNNQLAALSPYLLQAANPSDSPLMIIAVDLADSLDPAAVHRGLNGSQVMASRKNADYEKVAKTLVHVKGLTFTVQPGSPLAGNLTVDFDTDTSAIIDFAKPLLLEILQNAGVYVQDFDSWRPRLKDRSIGISGTLSLNALRKFGTLIRTPVPAPEAASMTSYQSMDPAERAAAVSKRYFKSVTQILSDLKADKSKTAKSLASWYNRYADQIDKLPILDVDPVLIRFASSTSEHLRAMGASLGGISLQLGYLNRQKIEGQVYNAPSYTGNYGYYNWYGGYWGGGYANLANNAALYRSGTAGGVTTVNNYNQIYQMQDNLVTQGNAARIELWQRIDNETADVRRQMTQKYRTEF
jgi:hypothetical protein